MGGQGRDYEQSPSPTPPYLNNPSLSQCNLQKKTNVLVMSLVVIAFAVSALLAWITTFAHLILSHYPKPRRTNTIDQFVTAHLGNWVRSHVKNPDVFADCFFRVTLTLSDQQVVTGIAIMIAGLKLLAENHISIYHFSVVRELAFFSSNAHLLSLISLWAYLSSDRKRYRTTGRYRRIPLAFSTKWRLVCFFAFFVLFLTVTWMGADRDWDNEFGCPVKCASHNVKDFGGQPLGWAIAITYLLFTGYTFYALQLGEALVDRNKTVRRWIIAKWSSVDDKVTRRIARSSILLKLFHGLKTIAYAWRMYVYSDAMELLTMLGWYTANLYWLIEDKKEGSRWMSDEQWTIENEYGFGQIVPLVLLVLPIMTFLEAYYGKKPMHWFRSWLMVPL
ncbi:hypothetical protein BU24DRAFT_414484 [Aaosphaeria arxii CBS 175.79]|uniref:Uncharacterized protein n=1 Tax=Aaosphaeria arxii CBS 175.79 TaxID=1450172 RepID=A0A6A5XAV6_9PLEO|nr:uncharacterized protein BU24DRAFT_414484 [Aaosphaeria arxii CBS 175.79]KAF2010043.1 hypothetical protein BU24DRAFT_414484 [Aaosphaeria arxii CBS 175.79]